LHRRGTPVWPVCGQPVGKQPNFVAIHEESGHCSLTKVSDDQSARAPTVSMLRCSLCLGDTGQITAYCGDHFGIAGKSDAMFSLWMR